MRAPASPYLQVLAIAAAVIVGLLVACVASLPNVDPNVAAPSVEHFAGVVAVDNTQGAAVDVYVLRDSTVARYLGDVPGLTAVAFPLQMADLAGAAIAFGGRFVGSHHGFDYVSPPMPARENTLYRWRLDAGSGSRLRSSQRHVDSEPGGVAGRLRVTNVARAAAPATFVLVPVVVSAPQ